MLTDPAFYTKLVNHCYYNKNPDRPRWISLTNSNFTDGTLRIRQSGCYYLKEKIQFAPNFKRCDYWPRFDTAVESNSNNATEWPMGPYSLGFFAAITVEADDVVLDLNNKTIEATLEMALKQVQYLWQKKTISIVSYPCLWLANQETHIGCPYIISVHSAS